MSRISGITIELLQQTQSGTDAFNRPIMAESWIRVDNVLVGEPTTDDIMDTLNLTGKHLAYVLGIPKGDKHKWYDTEVRFDGQRFRTIGYPTQGIDAMVPLKWNMKVKVERYG